MLAAPLVMMPSASAQEPPAVTLQARRTTIDFGGKTALSGRATPVTPGEPIEILDDEGRVVGTTTTDDKGRFSAEVAPRHNTTYVARSLAATSEDLEIKVRPRVSVNLWQLRPFGRAVVRGTIVPAQDNARIKLALRHGGKVVAQRSVRVNGRQFRTRLYVDGVGTFKARATFTDDDHAWAAASSPKRITATPSLNVGSKGTFVWLLERRLQRLHYHIAGIGGSYDYRTADAMRAFNKVQGRARLGNVDASTWRALGDPIMPKPRAAKPDFHFEVDQTKQVTYVVKDGKITRIIHVSTGAGAATRDGVWHVHRKLAGTSGNGLYYPSYFDGLRAFHGWPEVPTYNASHGCVRLPMWTATWVFDHAPIGVEVRIYH